MNKWLISKKHLNFIFLVFSISFFAALIGVVLFRIETGEVIILDFISFTTGAHIIRSGDGLNIYNIETQTNYQQQIVGSFGYKIGSSLNLLPFLNFPALAVLFIPFTFIDFISAFKLYILILLILLLIISFLASRIFKNIHINSFWSLLPFLYYPSLGATLIGQTSIPLTLLFLLIYSQIKQHKSLLAGILSGLIILKIQYVIIISFLLFIVKNKGEYLKGTILSFGLIFGLSFFLTGFFWEDYFNLLANAQKPEYGLLDSKMFTLYGSLKQIKPFSGFSFNNLFLINAMLFALSLTGFMKLRKRLKFDKSFLLAVILTMIFCLHGVDYDQSLLLIPIYILLNLVKSNEQVTKSDKIALLLIILTPILIIIEKGVFAPFLLFAIVFLLLPKIKPPRDFQNPL